MVAISLAFIMFALSKLSNGHSWGDDFGLYLHVARNIVNGRPYNELNLGAQVPPGFPIILASWSKIFGWTFAHFKIINVLSWTILVLAVFNFCKRVINPIAGLCASIFLFLNPYYFLQQQSILSDLPFAALATIVIIQSFWYLFDIRLDVPTRRTAVSLALIGVLLYAALIVRPAGLPLIPAICCASLIQAVELRADRSRSFESLLIGVLGLIVLGLYFALNNSSAGGAASHILAYLAGDSISVSAILANRIVEEATNLHSLVFLFPFDATNLVLLLAGCAVGAAAFYWLTHDYVFILYVTMYTGLIVLTPWQGGPRYLFPILPFLWIFAFSPFGFVSNRGVQPFFKSRWGAIGLCSMSLILAIAVGVRTNNTFSDFTNYNDDETNNAPTRELIDWISKHTSPTEMICTFKPRAFMFFTERATCHLHPEVIGPLGPWLAQQRASIGVLILRDGWLDFADRLASDSTVMEVFRNKLYVVLRPSDDARNDQRQ
jgi:cytochrome c oxidase subunit 4